MKDTESLAHTTWNCKYHIVFAPKYRRKVFYGEKRREIGAILRQLCEWKGVEIIEAEVCPDHVHMCIKIPPKMSVSGFMGFLKGKSSVIIYSRFANLKFKYRNNSFFLYIIMAEIAFIFISCSIRNQIICRTIPTFYYAHSLRHHISYIQLSGHFTVTGHFRLWTHMFTLYIWYGRRFLLIIAGKIILKTVLIIRPAIAFHIRNCFLLLWHSCKASLRRSCRIISCCSRSYRGIGSFCPVPLTHFCYFFNSIN